MSDDKPDTPTDKEVKGDNQNNFRAAPDVLKPFRVGFHDRFAPDPAQSQIVGSIASMEAGMERIGETQDLTVKKGNTVVLYAGVSDPTRDFKFVDFYNRVALAQEKGAPIDLSELDSLKISDHRISFRFPDRNFVGDKFWVLLSGREGVRPIILKATLVLKTAEQEADEQRQKAEEEKRRAEEAQKQSLSPQGKTDGGFTMDVVHGVMGGITGAVNEGVVMGMSQGNGQIKTSSDSGKALNKALATWKNEYNRSESESDTSSEVRVESPIETRLETETRAVSSVAATVSEAPVNVSTNISASVSAALPSFSAEQRESLQSIAANISQEAYANLKSSVSVDIVHDSKYEAARRETLETLQKSRGEEYVSALTPQQIHKATLQRLSESNPEVIRQYQIKDSAYGRAQQDPFVQNAHEEISARIETYFNQVAVGEEKQPELRLFLQDEISRQVWQKFAKDNPEKAAVYQNEVSQLRQALESQHSPVVAPISQEPSAQPQTAPDSGAFTDGGPQISEGVSPLGQPSANRAAVPAGAPGQAFSPNKPAVSSEERPQPQNPEQQEAARQVAALRKRGKPMDDIARKMGDGPKRKDGIDGKAPSITPSNQEKPEEEPIAKPTDPVEPSDKLEPGKVQSGQPADTNIPAPLRMPEEKTNPEPQLPGKANDLPAQQENPELPGQVPPQPEPPLPQAEPAAKQANVEDAAEKAIEAAGPAAQIAEKEALGAAFWWLFGFSWTIIPIAIYNIYWVFFHARHKKLYPLARYQKVIIVLLNLALFFLAVGLIAFLIKGCETLNTYHLDKVMGGKLCEVADAFKNGGLSAGVKEISSPAITPGGPINVSQWRPQIISATNSNGLTNACILTTIVAKESGGNKNAVSSTCSFDTMRGYDIAQHSGPLYDLNWNCGHAFGLTQIYIYPQNGAARWQDASTPSRFLFNHYYTIPELLDSDTNLNLGARYFANLLNSNPNINLSSYAQSLSSEDQLLWKAYRRYNGSGAAAEGYADDSMRRYSTCKTTGY